MQIANLGDFEVKAVEVQLPSQKGTDKVVLLRKPDLVGLLAGDGEIPDVLSSLVLTIMNKKRRDAGEAFELSRDNLPQIMKSLDLIAIASFVQPAVWQGDHTEDGRLPVSWLSLDDKGFVFAWALGAEYQPVSSFPAQQGAGVADVQPGDGLSDSSES